MNKLFAAVNDYITMRRNLGYKLRNEASVLNSFAVFATQKNKDTITTKLVLEFITRRSKSYTSRWPVAMISMIRRFAVYMHAIDPKTEIPQAHLLSCSYSRRKPRIFSKNDIISLLKAVRGLGNRYRFADTFYTLFALISVTGMRTSEALSLNDESVDLSEGILEIRQTKFRKSRKIPLHVSTTEMLKRYVRIRNKRYSVRKSFFVNNCGGKLDRTVVQRIFRKMCVTAGLYSERGLEPRIMDLRHTFVIRNLMRCYQEELDVDQVIPVLSVYLGHENPESTYWYLTSTPELLSLINLRAEKKYWGK